MIEHQPGRIHNPNITFNTLFSLQYTQLPYLAFSLHSNPQSALLLERTSQQRTTHKLLRILEKELATNLMAILCPWGHRKGHLGLLQDPVLYFQCNRDAFDIPLAAPPKYPVNAPAAAPAHKQARATNLAKQKAWNTYLIVATITCIQFTAATNDVYYAALNDPTEGLNTILLQDLVGHI